MSSLLTPVASEAPSRSALASRAWQRVPRSRWTPGLLLIADYIENALRDRLSADQAYRNALLFTLAVAEKIGGASLYLPPRNDGRLLQEVNSLLEEFEKGSASPKEHRFTRAGVAESWPKNRHKELPAWNVVARAIAATCYLVAQQDGGSHCEAAEAARRVVRGISTAMAGQVFIIPSVKKLHTEMDHIEILEKVGPRPVASLAFEYELSVAQVYRIIREHEKGRRAK